MLKETLLRWVAPFVSLPTTGVDISDQSIKYCSFGQKNGAVIKGFGEIEVPAGLVVDGEIQNEAELANTFRKLMAQAGRTFSRFVVVSLPEEKSFLRLIQIPKVKPQAVGAAVRWEIEGNIPLPLEELHYDYEVIEPLKDSLDHLDVVITALPKKIVESYGNALAMARLEPVALELESQAVVRAAIRDLREPLARLVVHLGRNTTSLTIVAGGAILFTTTIKLGGATFEENITRALNVSQEQAIMIKKEAGLDKHLHGGKVFSGLILAVSALADELKRTMEYYQTYMKHLHGANSSINEVILVGGDSSLFGLLTFLSSILKIPVRLGDPFSAVTPPHGGVWPIRKNQSLAFVAAIGLALRNSPATSNR